MTNELIDYERDEPDTGRRAGFSYPGQRTNSLSSILRPGRIAALICVLDFVVIVASGVGSGLLYRAFSHSDTDWIAFLGFGVFVASCLTAIMAIRKKYEFRFLVQRGNQLRDCLVVWSSIFCILAVVGFTMKVSNDFSRGSTLSFFFIGGIVLLFWRIATTEFVAYALKEDWLTKKKVLLVTQQGFATIPRTLAEFRRNGLLAIRTFEFTHREVNAVGLPTSMRDKIGEIIVTARNHKISDIYLLLDWRDRRTIDAVLSIFAVAPLSVHLVPDESTARYMNNPVSHIGATWATELQRLPLSKSELIAKRCIDLSLATSAIILLAPLLLLTALLIKLDSKGPVIFRQNRNGFSGHTFSIFKFRTMNVMENGSVVTQTRRNDPRVTRLGRWLRKSSIDELPQLLNVLRGEMSLVGPRPHAAAHNSQYEKLISNYAFRHHVKPGITGWAQVSGYRGETSTLDLMEKRVEYDIWYINNWSVWLDISIICRTALLSFGQNTAY